MEITPEMRTAMEFLRATGQKWHTTRSVKLDCGCWVHGGWVLDKMEPGAGVVPCSGEHREAAKRAYARWADRDSKERFLDVDVTEALVTLLREEIAAGES